VELTHNNHFQFIFRGTGFEFPRTGLVE